MEHLLVWVSKFVYYIKSITSACEDLVFIFTIYRELKIPLILFKTNTGVNSSNQKYLRFKFIGCHFP